VTKSRGRNGPCPEVALTESRFCACPVFSPRLFLSSSKMATGCDRRSLDPPSGFPWVCMRNRKLRNTRSSSKQCWLGCSLRRPRHVTGRGPVRKGPGPEICSAHAPFFPPRFFLSSSNMATGCDQRSLDPLRGSLGCATVSGATPIVTEGHVTPL
jgi:hypothetical protein